MALRTPLTPALRARFGQKAAAVVELRRQLPQDSAGLVAAVKLATAFREELVELVRRLQLVLDGLSTVVVEDGQPWKRGQHFLCTIFFPLPGCTRDAAARAAVEILQPFNISYFEYAAEGSLQSLRVLHEQRSSALKLEAPQLPHAYVHGVGHMLHGQDAFLEETVLNYLVFSPNLHVRHLAAACMHSDAYPDASFAEIMAAVKGAAGAAAAADAAGGGVTADDDDDEDAPPPLLEEVDEEEPQHIFTASATVSLSSSPKAADLIAILTEGHTPISAEEATDPANLNAMLFLIGQMFADIYKADGQVCLGVHTGDAAAIVNFLYDFGLIPDSLSSLKTVTSADIKRNRITFASTMRTGAPGPNALFDKHVPPGNKSVSVDPRHASPPEGSDEEARALLPFGAAVGDGGMGAVLSQAVFARERGTGGAAFYVVARPLAVAELYRNCMAPMFQALNLNLRRLSVTARSAGGEPLLHRFVVCGAYNVATMFNIIDCAMEAAVASAVRVPYLLQLVHMSGATAVYLLQPRKVGIYLELCSNGDIARTHDVPQSQRTFTYTFSQEQRDRMLALNVKGPQARENGHTMAGVLHEGTWWVDREQGLGVMGAAGARAADHWAQITELVRPAPDTHRLLRLATNSRNQHLLNHADQVGPRDGAGKATYGVQVNAVAVQALQRPASVDLRPDPANPRSKPDLASSAGWVATYPKVIRYTAFMGRDLLGLLATQEAHSGAPVPHPGPPGRSALVWRGLAAAAATIGGSANMHQATAHALTALREAHPALAVIVDDCFRPGQNYSLHRELLPACHAMRLEALRTRGGTIDGVRFRLLSFVGGDLVDVTLRMRRVRDVKEDSIQALLAKAVGADCLEAVESVRIHPLDGFLHQVVTAGGSLYPADTPEQCWVAADLASPTGYHWRTNLAAGVDVCIAAPASPLGGMLLAQGRTVPTAGTRTAAIGGEQRCPAMCLPAKDGSPRGPLFLAVEIRQQHAGVAAVPGLSFMRTGEVWMVQAASTMVQQHSPSQVAAALADEPPVPHAVALQAALQRLEQQQEAQEQKKAQRQQALQAQQAGRGGKPAAPTQAVATPAAPTPADREVLAPDSKPAGSSSATAPADHLTFNPADAPQPAHTGEEEPPSKRHCAAEETPSRTSQGQQQQQQQQQPAPPPLLAAPQQQQAGAAGPPPPPAHQQQPAITAQPLQRMAGRLRLKKRK